MNSPSGCAADAPWMPVALGEKVVSGIGQMVQSVALDDERPLCPAVQIRADVLRCTKFRGRGHTAAKDSAVIRPIGVPHAVVVDENGKINGMADVRRDFPERPKRGIAAQNVVSKAVWRGIHIKPTVFVHDFRSKGTSPGNSSSGTTSPIIVQCNRSSDCQQRTPGLVQYK